MTLSKTDLAVIDLVTDDLESADDPRLRLAVRVSAIAVDRWGRDLEADVGEQQYGAFEHALSDAASDVIDYYADEDGDIDGVDGHVFEGRVVEEDNLVEWASVATEKIVDAGGLDRDAPGGLVVVSPGGDEN